MIMKKFVLLLLFFPLIVFAQLATSLDTHTPTGQRGPDVWTYQLDRNNTGIAVWKHSFSLPINPSSGIPFALTVGGDAFMGDIYCLSESDNKANLNSWGCIYGKSSSGNRIGPVIYQVNNCINCDGGKGGPGIVMWPDSPNADKQGNQGYTSWIAWGQPASSTSNTACISNRDQFSGQLHTRICVESNGAIKFLDLLGSRNAHLCIHPDGTVYRGTLKGCKP